MVFAGMALKPCQMRVLATVPFHNEQGLSNGSAGHVAPAVGALAANLEGPAKAGERAGWGKTRKGEESEQKGKDTVCVHGEKHQEEMLQS